MSKLTSALVASSTAAVQEPPACLPAAPGPGAALGGALPPGAMNVLGGPDGKSSACSRRKSLEGGRQT